MSLRDDQERLNLAAAEVGRRIADALGIKRLVLWLNRKLTR